MSDSQGVQPSVVQQIAAAFAEVVESVNALNTQVQEYAEERRKTRIAVSVGVVVGLLFVAAIGASIWESRQGRLEIIDCTTPEGECFQEGQQRQAQAVDAIVCGNARDTRAVVRSIGEGFGSGLNVPALPEHCVAG